MIDELLLNGITISCVSMFDVSTVELTILEERNGLWLVVTLFEPQLVVVEQRGHDEDTPAPWLVSDTTGAECVVTTLAMTQHGVTQHQQ